MKAFFKNIYIDSRFFVWTAIIVTIFIVASSELLLLLPAQICLIALIVCSIVDIAFLFKRSVNVVCRRYVPDKLSNGDHNIVSVEITNKYPVKMSFIVIDEIPHQFQKRDFYKKIELEAGKGDKFDYSLRPFKRGVYSFGSVNVYACGVLGLFRRKYSFDCGKETAVYPSFLSLNKYALIAVSRDLQDSGLKKIRKINGSFEFEKISTYVTGDDPRTINWKASARKGELMVNKYIDERAQHIYSIVDMGRAMLMPFDSMSLLDYSINASLAISSVSLKKFDKPGLITFNTGIQAFIKADSKKAQMLRINESLYSASTDILEPNYPLLCEFVKRKITQRSLLIVYTNFDTFAGMERRLEYFKLLAKNHLVVVVFFKNTELNSILNMPVKTEKDVYRKITVEKMLSDKRRIIPELRKYGIISIYSEPSELSVNLINKYLEIKMQRLI